MSHRARETAFAMLLAGICMLRGTARAEETPAAKPAAPVESAAKAAAPKSSVGMPARMEQVVLPGSELEALRSDNRDAPVVLRIVASYPHGTARRYDFEYYGLEPGHFDLRKYLRRKDASTVDDLPELPIEIVSRLAPGQILPHDPPVQRTPWLGGYRALLIAGGLFWIAILLTIALARRRKRGQLEGDAEPSVSLAEQLTPLVTSAVAGKLDPAGQAQLERLLLTYWRRRLDLEGISPAAAIDRLRQHEQAGQLLRQVEAWLHRPDGAGDVDVAALLEPYRHLPADEPVGVGA